MSWAFRGAKSPKLRREGLPANAPPGRGGALLAGLKTDSLPFVREWQRVRLLVGLSFGVPAVGASTGNEFVNPRETLEWTE
jgi:hypothetical protein